MIGSTVSLYMFFLKRFLSVDQLRSLEMHLQTLSEAPGSRVRPPRCQGTVDSAVRVGSVERGVGSVDMERFF